MAFRQWLNDKAGGDVGWAGGATSADLPQRRTRQQLLSRWDRHTKDCASCKQVSLLIAALLCCVMLIAALLCCDMLCWARFECAIWAWPVAVLCSQNYAVLSSPYTVRINMLAVAACLCMTIKHNAFVCRQWLLSIK